MMNISQRIDRWFTAPETNAAGRLGLYRILYALFYLAVHMSFDATGLSQIPGGEWRPVLVLAWMPVPPNFETLRLVEGLWAVGLILLLVGWRVRLATLIVMITGLFMISTRLSFGKIDHGNTFLAFYIPLIMLFSHWGSTYSLDALIRQRQKILPPVSPSESHWHYAWPIRAILWLVSIMFMMSGYIKLVPGVWLSDFETVPKLLLGYNAGANPNPLNPIIAAAPLIYLPLHFGALLFETLFPLALINNKWRTFCVSSAIFFHLFIYLFMHINMVHMLIIYALFIDWQRVIETLHLDKLAIWERVGRIPTPALIIGSMGIAFMVAFLWQLPGLRQVAGVDSFFHLYLWYLAVPMAAFGLVRSGKGFVQDIVSVRSGLKIHY